MKIESWHIMADESLKDLILSLKFRSEEAEVKQLKMHYNIGVLFCNFSLIPTQKHHDKMKYNRF